MNFTEALNKICDGQKVTRKEWDNKEEYGFLHEDRLRIHIKGKIHDWIVSYGDLLGEDWEVV